MIIEQVYNVDGREFTFPISAVICVITAPLLRSMNEQELPNQIVVNGCVFTVSRSEAIKVREALIDYHKEKEA